MDAILAGVYEAQSIPNPLYPQTPETKNDTQTKTNNEATEQKGVRFVGLLGFSVKRATSE